MNVSTNRVWPVVLHPQQFSHYVHICPVVAQMRVKSNLCARWCALDLTVSHAVALGCYKFTGFTFQNLKRWQSSSAELSGRDFGMFSSS